MTTLPKNREEPHTKVLLPRGACSPAPQPGMKLVHGPVIIGDSKNTGSASTTFPWGSKRTGNSESSDTWPDTINSRPTPKITGLPAELCWVTAADNMGRDYYPKFHKRHVRKSRAVPDISDSADPNHSAARVAADPLLKHLHSFRLPVSIIPLLSNCGPQGSQ